jgi:hypothetical protein
MKVVDPIPQVILRIVWINRLKFIKIIFTLFPLLLLIISRAIYLPIETYSDETRLLMHVRNALQTGMYIPDDDYAIPSLTFNVLLLSSILFDIRPEDIFANESINILRLVFISIAMLTYILFIYYFDKKYHFKSFAFIIFNLTIFSLFFNSNFIMGMSSLIIPDTLLFTSIALLILSTKYIAHFEREYFVVSVFGILSGILIGLKYNVAVLILPVTYYLFYKYRKFNLMVLYFILTLLFFIMTTPGSIIQFESFRGAILYQIARVKNDKWIFWGAEPWKSGSLLEIFMDYAKLSIKGIFSYQIIFLLLIIIIFSVLVRTPYIREFRESSIKLISDENILLFFMFIALTSTLLSQQIFVPRYLTIILPFIYFITCACIAKLLSSVHHLKSLTLIVSTSLVFNIANIYHEYTVSNEKSTASIIMSRINNSEVCLTSGVKILIDQIYTNPAKCSSVMFLTKEINTELILNKNKNGLNFEINPYKLDLGIYWPKFGSFNFDYVGPRDILFDYFSLAPSANRIIWLEIEEFCNWRIYKIFDYLSLQQNSFLVPTLGTVNWCES